MAELVLKSLPQGLQGDACPGALFLGRGLARLQGDFGAWRTLTCVLH
ncbi:MAG: hypothetical protein RL385_5919, partial [Pseudomonadota bacterium]